MASVANKISISPIPTYEAIATTKVVKAVHFLIDSLKKAR